MRILFALLLVFSLSYSNDATIEVIKKVESLPTLAIEDASVSYDDTFRLKFFKSLVADMNVISLFNVDRHHRKTHFNDTDAVVENKDMDYVLRYKLSEDDDGALNIELKLINAQSVALSKNIE